MAITTVSEVKALNQISGSSFDEAIVALIPLISDYIVTYCRMTEESIESNHGLRLAASQMIKYQLSKPSTIITSEKLGDYAVTYTMDYPDHIIRILDTYKNPNYISDTYSEAYNEQVGFFSRGTGISLW